MPWDMALVAFGYGAAFGLLPVGWTIFFAMLLYNITVETGQFTIIRRSVAGLSGDARIQAILIGFSFGAFLEGAAGGGTPVAICGAIMVGLGFDPFLAAVLCLIANTSPVAYGGLGHAAHRPRRRHRPADARRSRVMAGDQLPFLSCIVPLYMVKCMCTWRQTWEVWPALLVAGGSFAVFQYFFATTHLWIGVELFPMTDIGGGIFSLVVTAVFLQFWKPRTLMLRRRQRRRHQADAARPGLGRARAAHGPPRRSSAWMPFVLMSVVLIGGRHRARGREPAEAAEGQPGRRPGPDELPDPGADAAREVERDQRLLLKEQGRDAGRGDVQLRLADRRRARRCLLAALVSMVMLRMNRRQIGRSSGGPSGR